MTFPVDRIVVALAAAAWFGGAAFAQQPAVKQAVAIALAPDAREAAAVVDRFHEALASGDLSGAAALLDDDALIFESGGVERSKAEYAAHHLPADAAFSKAVGRQITARAGQSRNGLAWVATESRMSGSFNGKPVDRLAIETMILRRNGGWKIVHIHWSSAAAKKA